MYDISQEVFSCAVFPGDPQPERRTLLQIENGDICNLTAFSMCAHNGTHIDAPRHFIPGGKTVDQIPPEVFTGRCFLARAEGILSAEDARRILTDAQSANAAERILLGGELVVSLAAAEVFAEAGVLLLGNESQTFGDDTRPGCDIVAIHKTLLSADTVLLEGIRLHEIPPGAYFLSAAPLHLGGADGAPCRAVLWNID